MSTARCAPAVAAAAARFLERAAVGAQRSVGRPPAAGRGPARAHVAAGRVRGCGSTWRCATVAQAQSTGAFGGIDRSNMPEWVRVLEDGAQSDEELLEIINGTNGDPALIEERIRERFRRGADDDYFSLAAGPGDGPLKVSFREVDTFNLYLWLEFYTAPSEREQELLEEVVKSWFVVGKLGGFNADNLQVQDQGPDVSYMDYDATAAGAAEPSWFHNMGSFEYRECWGRCWFDLGTADNFAVDVLINSLTSFSIHHVGIKQLIVGGENRDWPAGVPGQNGEEDDEEDDEDIFRDNLWQQLGSTPRSELSRRADFMGDA